MTKTKRILDDLLKVVSNMVKYACWQILTDCSSGGSDSGGGVQNYRSRRELDLAFSDVQ